MNTFSAISGLAISEGIVIEKLIKDEIEKRKLISSLIIRAFKTVSEKSSKKSQVGTIQDAVFSISGIKKNPQNRRVVDLTLKKHGLVRSVYSGKHYYKNIVLKEQYGS
jgi:hypothetical protein